jgi:acetyl esterase/lipase
VLLAATMTLAAFCMTVPIVKARLGELGRMLLSFPLHLLLVTVLAAGFAIFSWWLGARLAVWVFGFVVLLTAGMALLPSVEVWRQARAWNVPVSLKSYLANAWHVNSGHAQQARTVAYGTTRDGTTLKLDVWRTGKTDTGPLRPAMVVVHGGGWSFGNRSETPDWNRWLNEMGYEVFDIEYRLPPPVRWLDEIGDVKSALGWVAAHAAEYHIDPACICMMGGSAGGNLALLAAYSINDPQLPPSTQVAPVAVRCVVNLYGATDMPLLYRAGALRALMVKYIGGTLTEFPNRYSTLSPLNHVSVRSPPTITLIGAWDRFVAADHATLLDEALSKVGAPHELYFLPASDHGFDSNWGGFATQIARAKIKRFLQQYGGCGPN